MNKLSKEFKMNYLSPAQIEHLKNSMNFPHEDQVKAIYPHFLQSIIIKTNSNKFYGIWNSGEIESKNYHDVIFYEDEMTLKNVLSQNQRGVNSEQ